MHASIKNENKNFKFLVTDVDGVFTDGKFYYSESGKILKKFVPHDSDGIKLLRQAGLQVNAISADHRGYKISAARMADLNIDLELVEEVRRFEWFKKKFEIDNTIFVGDGIFDAPLLEIAGLSFAPRNSVNEAKSASKHILNVSGSEGVFLEIARHLLNINFY